MNVCGRDICIEGRLVRIARLDADGFEFLENPSPVVEALRSLGRRIDLFTFMQKLSDICPKYSYPMEWDNLAALPVSTFDNWWMRQIDNKTRNMVRKAEKKRIALREVPFGDALVQGISEIYNECPIRQGRPFRHYRKNLETVRKEEMTFLDRSMFIGAFLDDKLIGFLKLTSDEAQTQAALMNIVSMIQHRDKAPTNALIAQAVRSCAEREIPFLVYSNFAHGKKQRDSLSDFKKNNGFKRIDLPRYYVPLTGTGRVALRLGLHHKIAEHFPEPVIATLRQFRNAWYNRRVRPMTEIEIS